jgi:riboflavin synthase
MFTGLVTALGTVRSVRPRGTGRELWIEAPYSDLSVGESVACDGICLTVEKAGLGAFQVAAGEETLRRTTVAELSPGSRIHLERALQLTDRLGGHIVQGHVDGIGTVVVVDRRPEFVEIKVEIPESLIQLFVEKGSVCIDGVSLTVNHVEASTFSVGIIPHTSAVTKLGQYAAGQRVNIETDVLAKMVQRMLLPYVGAGGGPDDRLLSVLRSSGFLKE